MAATTSPKPPNALTTLRVYAPAIVVRVVGAVLALSPFLPAIFHRIGMYRLAETFASPWQYTCHQMPERTLEFLGELMPLCSRCLGLVIGLGAGLAAAWPYYGPKALRLMLTAGALAIFVELTTQDLGWHPVFHPTRLLSGLIAAFPAGAAVGAIITRMCRERLEREKTGVYSMHHPATGTAS